MATAVTRWNLVVSKETDTALRQFLANEGGCNDDLSKFVEEAVRERIFEEMVRAARKQNEGVDPELIEQAIEEAIAWARSNPKT